MRKGSIIIGIVLGLILVGCDPPVDVAPIAPNPTSTNIERGVRIHGMDYTTYIIDSNDVLWSTGANSFGKLGIGTTVNGNTFQKVMTDVKAVYGKNRLLIIRNDNSLWVAGQSSVGDGTNFQRPSPVKVFENVKMAADGDYVSTALVAFVTLDGELYTWGDNTYGQLFNGETTAVDTYSPTFVRNSVKAVYCVQRSTFVIDGNDNLWSVGFETNNTLGNGPAGNTSTPVQILSNVEKVSISTTHALALLKTGELYAWGRKNSGQYGNGETVSSDVPLLIDLENVADISASGEFSVFLLDNGNVLTAGASASTYRLMNSSTTSHPNPTLVKTNAIDIARNYTSTIVLTDEGAVWGAGTNQYGELGVGNNDPVVIPRIIWHDWW
jgi:alpha-tubulin suppressor-like RCC1 family protein